MPSQFRAGPASLDLSWQALIERAIMRRDHSRRAGRRVSCSISTTAGDEHLTVRQQRRAVMRSYSSHAAGRHEAPRSSGRRALL